MTILYILISTDLHGGATKSFLALLQGVLMEGHRAIAVVPDRKGIYSLLQNMGAEVLVIPSRPNVWTDRKTLKQKILFIPRQIGRILINRWAARQLMKSVHHEHIDIIHTNNSITSIGQLLAKKRNIPHIYHIREYGDLDFGLTYFPNNQSMRQYFHRPGVYTISITRDIQSHHGLTGLSNSTVIYNGIIRPSIISCEARMQGEALLYAGRIEPGKGLKDLLVAYLDYCRQEEKPRPLLIAGSPTDKAYANGCQHFVEDNQLSKWVTFLGEQDEMRPIYQRCSAIIIPSFSEGFGRSMAEAMAEGCIPIGRYTGGTREQLDNLRALTDQRCSFSFHTPSELTQCLVDFHAVEAEELYAMQAVCKNAVKHYYSDEQYVQHILNFYNRIMGNDNNR